jgi:hypothetical protein
LTSADSPLSGDDQWFEDWFDQAWNWFTSPAEEDAIPKPIEDPPSLLTTALPSLPPSMFRSSGIVRGPSTRRRDPMAGETLRASGGDRRKVDALRMECADPLSPIGGDLKWLRRDVDLPDPDGSKGDDDSG